MKFKSILITKVLKSNSGKNKEKNVCDEIKEYKSVYAKKFLELHKDKIWVESAGKGKGSTFYVELPTK